LVALDSAANLVLNAGFFGSASGSQD